MNPNVIERISNQTHSQLSVRFIVTQSKYLLHFNIKMRDSEAPVSWSGHLDTCVTCLTRVT